MTEPLYRNILAVDTATATLRLGMCFGRDRRVKSDSPAERSHGQMIIRRIDDLCQSAGLQKRDIEAIVVSLGPGSFTGLRIGLAAVKGIAVALGIPVAGVSLFEVAAHKLRNVTGPVLLLIHHRRDSSFVVEIESGSHDIEAIREVALMDLQGIIGNRRVLLIGVDRFAIPTGSDIATRVETLDYDALDLLDVGIAKLSGGAAGDIAGLEPMYVQKSQAEIRFEARQKKQ